MKLFGFMGASIYALLMAGAVIGQTPQASAQTTPASAQTTPASAQTTPASAQTFTLKSNEIGGQATQHQFLNSFGCHGDNVSPELSWENPPAGTQAFAITMYDKDAPTGSGFWHWVVFNIPAEVHELKSGAGDPAKNLIPAGAIQSLTDFGKAGYGGPCPPPGTPHEYLITVYALKTKLSLDQNATPALVGFNLYFNTIVKASIVMYGQQ